MAVPSSANHHISHHAWWYYTIGANWELVWQPADTSSLYYVSDVSHTASFIWLKVTFWIRCEAHNIWGGQAMRSRLVGCEEGFPDSKNFWSCARNGLCGIVLLGLARGKVLTSWAQPFIGEEENQELRTHQSVQYHQPLLESWSVNYTAPYILTQHC